jgi:hypothetical protein
MATMSDPVLFKIYYGTGEIQSGPNGVVLCGFPVIEHPIQDPEKMVISEVVEWMTGFFGLDPALCGVDVRCVFSRSRQAPHLDLIELDRTKKWRSWLEALRRRGGDQPILLVRPAPKQVVMEDVQALTVGESSAAVGAVLEEVAVNARGDGDEDAGAKEEAVYSLRRHIEPTGQADEGEDNESVLEAMEREDAAAFAEEAEMHEDDEEDASDEEGGPATDVPGAWNQELLGGMSVNDGHDSPWEYQNNEVRLGSVYPDKASLKQALLLWAMSMQRTFRTTQSSPRFYTVKCEAPECSWHLHAHVPKYETYWVVSKLEPHTCIRSNVLQHHRNLTSTMIASLMFGEIVQKKDMEAKHIQIAMSQRYKYDITYAKAWRAKQKAMEMRFGTFEAAYDNLPRLLETLKERNPGTYCAVKDVPSVAPPGYRVMQRAMFSFGACIESFRHCRPVLCVDGTFLTGKYQGQILTAIGVDGNDQILPLAVAFVEGENYQSWLWFFRHLKVGVVKDRPNVCVLHDRHAGILKAVKQLQEGPDEPFPWRDMQNRWCMRHLGANFFRQFKNKRLMNIFKRLCRQNQRRKFDALWERLDDLTKQEIRQRANRAQQARKNPHDSFAIFLRLTHPVRGGSLRGASDVSRTGSRKSRSRNGHCFTTRTGLGMAS